MSESAVSQLHPLKLVLLSQQAEGEPVVHMPTTFRTPAISSYLVGIHISQAVLDMAINDKFSQTKNFTAEMESVSEP